MEPENTGEPFFFWAVSAIASHPVAVELRGWVPATIRINLGGFVSTSTPPTPTQPANQPSPFNTPDTPYLTPPSSPTQDRSQAYTDSAPMASREHDAPHVYSVKDNCDEPEPSAALPAAEYSTRWPRT